jgi:hypothetical protein
MRGNQNPRERGAATVLSGTAECTSMVYVRLCEGNVLAASMSRSPMRRCSPHPQLCKCTFSPRSREPQAFSPGCEALGIPVVAEEG